MEKQLYRKGAVTIKDVAAHAGVSFMTVSAVLNGNNSNRPVALATRDRVMQSARLLRYVRNNAAAAFKSGRTNSLGVVARIDHDGRAVLRTPFLMGVVKEMQSQNQHLVLADATAEDIDDPAGIPTILRRWVIDGLMVELTYDRRIIEAVESHNIPAIWINTNVEMDAVMPDDFQVGLDLARTLIQAGHRNILYLDYDHDYPEVHHSVAFRSAGFIAAMREAGLNPRFHTITGAMINDDMLYQAAIQATVKQLSGEAGFPSPTAVTGYSDTNILIAWQAAMHLGWSVPRDLSILTPSAEKIRFLGQTLSTYQNPWFEIGKSAVTMLRQKIEAPADHIPSLIVPFTFEAGTTLAPPRPCR
jgi:LacI family transcriptional regulator